MPRWRIAQALFFAIVGLAVAGAKAADLSPAIVERLTEATVYIESHVVLAASDWQALPEAARKGLGKRPQGPASGWSIFDGNNNEIAQVDPKTGYINILNYKYEVRVLPATGVKPLRQAMSARWLLARSRYVRVVTPLNGQTLVS